MPKVYETTVPFTMHRCTATIRGGGRKVPIAYTMFKTGDGEHHSNWWLDNPDEVDPALEQLSNELTGEDEFFIWSAVIADIAQ